MELGFIGLGNIGLPAATDLIKGGHHLTVFDKRSEPLEMLTSMGAQGASNAGEVAKQSKVVFTSLPNPRACELVAFGENGILAAAQPGLVFIEMSTSLPSYIRRIGEVAKSKGVLVLDAGVTKGTVYEGEAKTCLIIGGDKDVLSRMRPILDLIAQDIVHAGDLGAGMTVKLVNNLMSLINLVTVCEGIALGVKAGVSPNLIIDVITDNSGDSYQLQTRGRRILERGDFKWGGLSLDLASKDCELIKDLARDVNLPLYMLSIAHTLYEHARAKGFADKDRAAVITLYEELIGNEISE